jgi:hypothetical protein
MNSTKLRLKHEAAAMERPNVDLIENTGLGSTDPVALRRIFRILCYFVAYLFIVGLLGEVFKWSRLTGALLQFVPYCCVLVGVAYCGRTLAKGDKQTLFMVSCLVCVFIASGLDVTKNLRWFDAVPILGRDSRVRNDISSMAILLALASFPAASYFLIQDILLAKKRLAEQVDKLEEANRHVQRLQGLLPICMYCHKIRTDQQLWQQMEAYITEHSDAKFSHSLCPECAQKHFPELNFNKGEIGVKP